MNTDSLNNTPGRIQVIDLIRGVDIIFMVLFNYSVTLRYFGLIHIQPDLLYSVTPLVIASIFIFISGAAAYASFKNNKENFGKKFMLRGAKLLIFAAFITLFTAIFVPDGTIYFGILHFFAVSSFLVPVMVKYNKLNPAAGILIILSGFYLQTQQFSFPYLLWLGFMPENFSTFDYFPLIPWLGVLMLGVYSGKNIIEKTWHVTFKSKVAKTFEFLGKNSLTIYLIHQPVLIFILMLMGLKLF
ncbi:Uncharacterised protein [uncultured archaeon]|nr:Uncharacterised protein [uncultured archaeon]